jgi:peptidoglycan/xylan/chitin deacetylase (PgdA/CDA1 family)
MKVCFSYDCEGHWGFVDRPTSPLEAFAANDLADCYRQIAERHMRSDIPATFAFVALYAMPAEERPDFVQQRLEDVAATYPNLRNTGGLWDGAENLATIRTAATRSDLLEIGCHSLTHLPTPNLSDAALLREFRMGRDVLAGLTGASPASYVFPRNQVRLAASCVETFGAYRNTPMNRMGQKVTQLAASLSGIEMTSDFEVSDFLFWRSGIRKRFPDAGWKRLWRNRIARARHNGMRDQLFHVWSHPHNFLTDPGLMDRLGWLHSLLSENRDVVDFVPLSKTTTHTVDFRT